MTDTREPAGESASHYSKKHLLAGMLLWKELHGRKLMNYRFERNLQLLNRKVDFYCPELKLAIMITPAYPDGETGANPAGDNPHVLTFNFNRVINEMPEVLAVIQDWIIRHTSG